LEFIALLIIFFGIIGIFVFLFSGMVCLIFDLKKIHYLVLIGLNMLIGYFYAIVRDISELGLFAVLYNGLLTVLAIAVIRVFKNIKNQPNTLEGEEQVK
jgi:hypothetical protein